MAKTEMLVALDEGAELPKQLNYTCYYNPETKQWELAVCRFEQTPDGKVQFVRETIETKGD